MIPIYNISVIKSIPPDLCDRVSALHSFALMRLKNVASFIDVGGTNQKVNCKGKEANIKSIKKCTNQRHPG
ncbi:hypothetical protein ES703_06509 [subsurface metagenome]